MTFLETIFKHLHEALQSVTASDLVGYKEFLDPENPHVQIVRKCAALSKDIGLELCVRYDLQKLHETGIQDFGVELFSWASF